jgi:hypothetical protein
LVSLAFGVPIIEIITEMLISSVLQEIAWDASPVKNEISEDERVGELQVCLDR